MKANILEIKTSGIKYKNNPSCVLYKNKIVKLSSSKSVFFIEGKPSKKEPMLTRFLTN